MDQMIIIDDILISDDIVREEFICNLTKCKGGCCVDGDAGAPLNRDELEPLREAYEVIKGELSDAAKKEIKRSGAHTHDDFFGDVTPAINGVICVYGYIDEQGVVKCLLEKAWNEGRTTFRKPISCHLYPIRESRKGQHVVLNYEPRESLCAPACKLGKKEGVKVYKFLREPLIRRFGEEFYQVLDRIARGDFESEKE